MKGARYTTEDNPCGGMVVTREIVSGTCSDS